jgi:6-phosphogluconolactonase
MAMLNRRQFLYLLGLGTPAFIHEALNGTFESNETTMTNRSVTRKSYLTYVGCRTTQERNARGKGINVYRVNAESGKWSHLQLLGGLTNPSFLAFDKPKRFLYCVHGDFDEVSAFSVGSDGLLSFVNRQKSGGTNPVHLCVDPEGKYLVVANYATGSIATLPIQADGSLAALRDLVQLPGVPGPHRTEQTSSHPHQVAFSRDGKFIVVPDKGLDRIFVLELNTHYGTLVISDVNTVTTRSGAGPRHVAFSPILDFLYVVNELDSTVTTYCWRSSPPKLHPLERISTLPNSFTSNNTGAEIAIHPSARYLYCSNRGHDSIATFAISSDGASLSPLDWQLSQGEQPRFFALDPSGSILYAANEASDSIVPFRINSENGTLQAPGYVLETGSPVCIVFKNEET